MHGNGPYGRVTSPAPQGQTGDVDRDGQIVDELRRRLGAAIDTTAGEVDRERHLDVVLEAVAAARVRAARLAGQRSAGWST